MEQNVPVDLRPLTACYRERGFSTGRPLKSKPGKSRIYNSDIHYFLTKSGASTVHGVLCWRLRIQREVNTHSVPSGESDSHTASSAQLNRSTSEAQKGM